MCGISDDHIQQRLLSRKGLTYKKALESLQGLETAAKNVRELQSAKQEPAQVRKVTPDGRGGVQTAGVGRGCFRCGNTAHSPSHCQEVFGEELGMLKGYEAKIHIDAGVTPWFCGARPVLYAMRVKVEQELERLVREGILEPVQHSDWAVPIVLVLKGPNLWRL